MHKGFNRRKYVRVEAKCQFKLLSSVSPILYSVELADISKGGAFTITNHRPKLNETVTIYVFNTYGHQLFTINGVIKNHRSINTGFRLARGCGIQFCEELTEEQFSQVTELAEKL